jgi:hypothetical protein
MAHEEMMKLIPLPPSPFASEKWFPAEKLNRASITYDGGEFTSVSFGRETGDFGMNMGYARVDFDIEKTLLDTLVANNVDAIVGKTVKVGYGKDAAPYLIASKDAEFTICSVTEQDGERILHRAVATSEDMPAGAFDEWLDSLM